MKTFIPFALCALFLTSCSSARHTMYKHEFLYSSYDIFAKNSIIVSPYEPKSDDYEILGKIEVSMSAGYALESLALSNNNLLTKKKLDKNPIVPPLGYDWFSPSYDYFIMTFIEKIKEMDCKYIFELKITGDSNKKNPKYKISGTIAKKR